MPGSQAHSPAFHTFSTNEADQDGWRADSQRVSMPPDSGSTHSPRGRGRGGRGGRAGRPRKSAGNDQGESSTPEWEKPDWSGTQMTPEGYYNGSAKRAASVVRRGSSGGQPVSRPMSQAPADPYAHTKKTRTKPTRNADGILIRKDGRPDMRSQSSAANLRKVHARKEAERAQELQQNQSPSARSKGISAADEPDPNTEEGRHRANMNKIFPRGVENHADHIKRQLGSRNGSHSPAERKPMVQDGLARHSSESELSDPEDDEAHDDEHSESRMDLDEATPESESRPAPAADSEMTGEQEKSLAPETSASESPVEMAATKVMMMEAQPAGEAAA